MMKEYESNEKFFQAFEELVRRIADRGNREAAQELRHGFSCLNGLTDGWALLMESIEKTVSRHQRKLDQGDAEELRQMLRGVKKAVYRR